MAINFSKLSVLIVEDNHSVLDLLSTILHSLGFGRIFKEENGEDAYVTYMNRNPDIIITDWEMAPMNGIQLTKKIREDLQNPNRMIPIILLTGYSYHERVEEARDAGVTEFLVKPFSAEELMARITHVINKPRDFLETEEFIGPDRRRRDDPSYKDEERRSDEPLEKLDPEEFWGDI